MQSILSLEGVAQSDGLRVRELVTRGSVAFQCHHFIGSSGLACGRDRSAARIMRISVNLASRPFVELRPFFARLRTLMATLALIGIALGVVLHMERKKLDLAEHQMDDLRRRTVAVQDEKLRNENRMRQPANSAVLDRAHFLNALFLRKSFSWTAVMMDLENVLPIGVHVTAIEPSITTDGDVIIRLRVSGDRDRAVQLVRNLERSSRFIAPRLSNETTQSKEQAATAAASGVPPGGVEFRHIVELQSAALNPEVVGLQDPEYRGAEKCWEAKSATRREAGATRRSRAEAVRRAASARSRETAGGQR